MSDNVLGERRTGLALLNLQATPMVPGVNASDSNPQKADGHIINDNTRTLFPAWPEDSVVKVRDTSTAALKNVLTFKCRPYAKFAFFAVYSKETTAGQLDSGANLSACFYSSAWTGGDDEVYSAATVYYNIYNGMIDHDNDPNTPDVPDYSVTTITYVIDPNGSSLAATSISTVNQQTPITTGAAFADQSLLGGGGTTNITAYATFTGKLSYADVIADPNIFPAVTYPTVTHQFSARADADDPHGLKEYVGTDGENLIPPEGGFFTYVQANTDSPAGQAFRYLVRSRWHYAPDAGLCGTCPFAGKTVTIEAKFKQATATNTFVEADGGVYNTLSLGSWSDHSTETFTLTLPDTLTAGDIGSDFDFPTSPGKVIALDDLRLVSIS